MRKSEAVRWLVGVAIVVGLGFDGWGCGGFVEEYDDGSNDSAPVVGWCCDGLCGLSAEDATSLQTTCRCAGVVAYREGTIGDCIERAYP